MLDVTLNESEIIKNALEGNYDKDNITITLNLLTKYYYLQDIKEELQLKEKILEYLKINFKGYKRAKWEATISKMVNRFLSITKKYKVNVKIIDISLINITRSELMSIKHLDDIKLEKIAFIMLIYAKIANIIIDDNKGWINKSCTTICKEAKVNLNGIEKQRIFNKLYKTKYIVQRKNNTKTNMKVQYINNKSEIKMIVDNFSNVIYYYILWRNKDMIKCSNCGKPIKMKNNKVKYCSKCAKENYEEQHRKTNKESMRKKRSVDKIKKSL